MRFQLTRKHFSLLIVTTGFRNKAALFVTHAMQMNAETACHSSFTFILEGLDICEMDECFRIRVYYHDCCSYWVRVWAYYSP